jgi:hypothetical protein
MFWIPFVFATGANVWELWWAVGFVATVSLALAIAGSLFLPRPRHRHLPTAADAQ